jgi:hypothetical protein
MEEVRAILINSAEKIIQEVFITKLVKESEFFTEANILMYEKFNYEEPEMDDWINLYDEKINFNPGHHNVFAYRFNYGLGSHVKTNNPDIFNTILKEKHLYIFRKILIIGQVVNHGDELITILPLNFTLEEITNSVEWRFKRREREPKMSKWEAQAEAEEIMKRISDNGYY